jgi:hypothetical protein
VTQKFRIAPQQCRDIRIDSAGKFKPFRVGLHGHGRDRDKIRYQAVKVKIERFDLHFPCLDLGIVENTIDDGQKGLPAAANYVSIATLLRRRIRVQQKPGHAAESGISTRVTIRASPTRTYREKTTPTAQVIGFNGASTR